MVALRVVTSLASFVLVSALAGVLIAGLALPVVGTVGLTAKAASDHFEDIPDDFTAPQLPQRNTMVADDGSVIATEFGYEGNRVVEPITAISKFMPEALVSIEDQRFWQHGGIDFKGTVRAIFNDSSGGALQGGSDIAQQYVKNVLILEAGTDTSKVQQARADTFTRKLTELKYAIVVEQTMSKEQLLDNYMNLIFFGENTYGVEAAAEHYFSTTAENLTPPQAALLAAIINSPDAYDPVTNPQNALARRNIVLQDMALPSLNYLTPTQAAAYEKTGLGLNVEPQNSGCLYANGSAAFFCDYVKQTFLNDPTYGATEADRLALWNLGGLTVQTTMSPQDEQDSDKAISQKVYASDYQSADGTKKDVASALAMIQPGTGEIKAIAQSVPMGANNGQTYIDFAADPEHHGGDGFQAGSSFKIFVGLVALQDGINPNQTVTVPAALDDAGTKVAVCQNGATSLTWGTSDNTYTSMNDGNTPATVNMTGAYAQSINNYFVKLEESTGLCKPAELAQKMGVTQDNDTDTGNPLAQILSFTLGSNPVTPIAMASAYATLAAQGTYCVPYVITGVTDVTGKQYGGQTQNCSSVIAPNLANELTKMLTQVIDSPDGTAYGAVNLNATRPVAGKTGTTNSGIATWFDGYTPQLATAVWTGYVDWAKESALENIKLGPSYYSGLLYGASVSAPIWNTAMTLATENLPVEQFTQPTGYNQPDTGVGKNGGHGGNGGAAGPGGTGGNAGTGANGNGTTTGNPFGGLIGF